MKLNYKIVGEGPTIVILHGLFGMLDNWYGIAKDLSEDYQVVLVDLRNHGLSPHSEEWNYDVMAADVEELFEELNLIKPILIGHSMGGKTAMTLATNYPELLRALVVVDISPRYYPVHHHKILGALDSLDIKGATSRSEIDKQMAEHLTDFGVRQFLLKNVTRLSEGGYEMKMNYPVISENIEEVGRALDYNAKYEGATLFLAGSKSDYILEEDQIHIDKHFPNNRVKYVEDAGHWIHAEQPEKFLTELKKFLEDA